VDLKFVKEKKLMKFTKEELILLEVCFDMNAGDNYVRNSLFPEWLKKDHNFNEAKTEKIFKSIAKKFKELN
tara:strand:- start:247 stop:459 length:213 start_codon:yes stop_codon:yes gene_type:complete